MSVTIKFSQMISKHKVQRKVKNWANRLYRLDINLFLGKPAYGAAYGGGVSRGKVGNQGDVLRSAHFMIFIIYLCAGFCLLGTKKDGNMMPKAVN